MGWRAADQAGAAARPAALALALALAGCSPDGGIHRDIDLRIFANNLFYSAHLQGREPPPGADQPWPSLSSVPSRPAPPDAAARAAISGTLAADRERARTPLGLGGGVPPAPQAGPPPPPLLAALPRVAAEPPAMPAAAPAPTPAAAPVRTPAAPVATIPAAADQGPAPPRPAAEAFAPPPPPPADLLAPPPPPSADLLAPRRN